MTNSKFACRLCGSMDLVLFYELGSKNQFKFYKCTNCKFVNIDLKNVKITENQSKYVDIFQPPKNYEKEKEALSAFKFVSKHVHIKGKYLDIGCGIGSVLYFFKKDGWEVRGLELSNVFADHVKSALNIDVYVSNFMVYKVTEHYELVSLRHVLEHIPDSITALNKIAELLKTNGFAYFEFPNINGLSHKIQRLKGNFKSLKRKYSDSFVPAHCNEFSKESFQYLLEKTGFKLIRWETYSKKPIMNFIYNRFHFGTKARTLVQKI